MDKIQEFLRKKGVAPELVDLDRTVEAFLDEMDKGMRGAASSLPMIPSYIGERFAPQSGECVAAVDAGGTNLRVSKVRFDEDLQPQIVDIQKFPMPGSREPVDKDAFFDQLARQLAGILEDTGRLGFCFSYPVEILPSRDGRVIFLGKEVVVKGIEGAVIGDELHRALVRHGAKPFRRLSVINDTTASLLGGRLFHQGEEYSAYLGYILGTGTNTCCYVDNARLTKAPDLAKRPGRTAVNLESGYFDKMFTGSLDDDFDAQTLAPGDHRMEKMISGRYLGPLVQECLRQAAKAGLFSPEGGAALAGLEGLETPHLDQFLFRSHGPGKIASLPLAEEDRQIVYRVIEALLERAARLIVSNFAACVRLSGGGTDPLRPALITVDGTTYYKCSMIKPKVDYYLEQYARRQCGLHIRTAFVEHAVTYGAALSAVCED